MPVVIIEDIEGCQGEYLTDDDREIIASYTSLRRRNEVIAWRDTLRRELAERGYDAESRAKIQYSPIGAPYFENSTIKFGVSHCLSRVAIIIDHKRCAIDIEECNRDFERSAARYATESERIILGDNEKTLPTIWAAKETLYKMAQRRGVELIGDIKIETIEGNIITGSVDNKEYRLSLSFNSDCVVVHTL